MACGNDGRERALSEVVTRSTWLIVFVDACLMKDAYHKPSLGSRSRIIDGQIVKFRSLHHSN